MGYLRGSSTMFSLILRHRQPKPPMDGSRRAGVLRRLKELLDVLFDEVRVRAPNLIF